MRIVITKSGKKFRADITDLLGSPWCGEGKTEALAVADCILGNLRLECYRSHLFKLASEGMIEIENEKVS